MAVAAVTDDRSTAKDHDWLYPRIAEHRHALSGTALGIRPGQPICKNKRLEKLVNKVSRKVVSLSYMAAE